MKIKLFIPICFLLIAIMGIGFASAADINNNTPSIEEPQFMELVDNSSNVIVESDTPVNINNDKENLYDYKDTNSSATFSNSIVNSTSKNPCPDPEICPKPKIKCLNTNFSQQSYIENEVVKYSKMLNLKQEIKDCFDLILEVYSTHSLNDTVKICADVLTLNKYDNKVYTIKDVRIMMIEIIKGVYSSDVRNKLIDIYMEHTDRPQTDMWFKISIIVLWSEKAIELGLLH